jgi:hypothetical protein
MELGAVPLVSKSLTYPKWVTNPFIPVDMSSVAKPKYLTSRVLPSATKGATVILPLPAVTPLANREVPFGIEDVVSFRISYNVS